MRKYGLISELARVPRSPSSGKPQTKGVTATAVCRWRVLCGGGLNLSPPLLRRRQPLGSVRCPVHVQNQTWVVLLTHTCPGSRWRLPPFLSLLRLAPNCTATTLQRTKKLEWIFAVDLVQSAIRSSPHFPDRERSFYRNAGIGLYSATGFYPQGR